MEHEDIDPPDPKCAARAEFVWYYRTAEPDLLRQSHNLYRQVRKLDHRISSRYSRSIGPVGVNGIRGRNIAGPAVVDGLTIYGTVRPAKTMQRCRRHLRVRYSSGSLRTLEVLISRLLTEA